MHKFHVVLQIDNWSTWRVSVQDPKKCTYLCQKVSSNNVSVISNAWNASNMPELARHTVPLRPWQLSVANNPFCIGQWLRYYWDVTILVMKFKPFVFLHCLEAQKSICIALCTDRITIIFRNPHSLCQICKESGVKSHQWQSPMGGCL